MKTVAYRGTIYEDHEGTLVPVAEQNGQAPELPAPDPAAYYGLAGQVVEVLGQHRGRPGRLAARLPLLVRLGSRSLSPCRRRCRATSGQTERRPDRQDVQGPLPQCEFATTTDPAILRALLKLTLKDGYTWVECGGCQAGWQVADCAEERVW
jgi:hypothetical protein